MKSRKDIAMKYWIKVLLTPSCWVQNHQYSHSWDRKLCSLMESERFTDYDGYTVKIGVYKLWVGNHPYASFYPYPDLPIRPKRATILRAWDKLVKDFTEIHDA